MKVFVDTAPLMEKPLAEAAGLGWQGKHTNLVSREFGSWLFLGAILTEAELPPDAAETDHCGSCRACLDICPTNAFPAPYRLDARRCISYLTIEHDGPIPREFRQAIGNRIYGCDDCLAVCPWNKFAQATREAKLAARDDLDAPPLAELAGLDDAGFRTRFSGSPIKRIGRDRFVRNVLIAIGNSAEPSISVDAAERISTTRRRSCAARRSGPSAGLDPRQCRRPTRDGAALPRPMPASSPNGRQSCEAQQGAPRPLAIGAVAVGAFAVGALALGALAIGALAIGGFGVGRARARSVRIDRLSVGTLEVERIKKLPKVRRK